MAGSEERTTDGESEQDAFTGRTGFARELHQVGDAPTDAEKRALAASGGEGAESAEEIAGDGHHDLGSGQDTSGAHEGIALLADQLRREGADAPTAENGGLMVVDGPTKPRTATGEPGNHTDASLDKIRALNAASEKRGDEALTDAKRPAFATGLQAPTQRQFDLENIFMYHAPDGEQLAKYARLRTAAYSFAVALIQETPAGADQSAALRHIREAVMTGNAAIALGGRL